MRLDYDVVCKSLSDLMFEFEHKTGVPWYRTHHSSSGHCRIGKYGASDKECVTIGVLGLDDALECDDRCVSSVDFVSMHKQCFHEYRHWIQYKEIFTGKNTFDLSSSVVRRMSKQIMIGSAFPSYETDNYWDFLSEIDAEEYAICCVCEYLKNSNLVSNNDIDKLVVAEINRRANWWVNGSMKIKVTSVDDAISKLRDKKLSVIECRLDCVDVDCLDFDSLKSPVCVSFMKDTVAVSDYLRLCGEDADKYLIDYICRHDKQIQKQHSVIKDLFPKLTISEKLKRCDYRRVNRLPDVNNFSRSLPDIDYLDNEHDDNQLGD